MRRKLKKALVEDNSKINERKRILAILQEAAINFVFLLLGFFLYLAIARMCLC